MEITDDKIFKLKERSTDQYNLLNLKNRKNRPKKKKWAETQGSVEHNSRRFNIHIIRVPETEEKEGLKEYFQKYNSGWKLPKFGEKMLVGV